MVYFVTSFLRGFFILELHFYNRDLADVSVKYTL